MKYFYSFIIATLLSSNLFAQYCIPVVTGSAVGKGITRVQLNEIDYSSVDQEGYKDYTILADTATLIKATSSQLKVDVAAFQFITVYIDWDQNDTFSGFQETGIFTAGSGTVNINIPVPTNTASGYTRMRIQTRTSFLSGGPCTVSQADGDIEDYTLFVTGLPMEYDTVTTTQITYPCFQVGRKDRAIVNLNIQTTLTENPLVLTEVTMNTNGTTAPLTDINNAKLMYGNNQFGATITSPNGSMVFTDTKTLISGNNSFSLEYDIPTTATQGNFVDAELTSFIIDSSGTLTTYTPPSGAPAGNQIIDFESSFKGDKRNNIWYFGKQQGIDFNCEPPSLTTGPTNLVGVFQSEGVATMSDPNTGELIFYTDGETIWDIDNNVILNGDTMYGGMSSTQSSIIIPMPENDSLYYFFMVDASSGPGAPKYGRVFSYSIINRYGNAGAPAVISKNNVLFSETFEQVTATYMPDQCGIWIIGHKYSSDSFYAYNLTSAGLNTTPVISKTGFANSTFNGQLRASHDGTMIANTLGGSPIKGAELFQFDNSTGIVSNGFMLLNTLVGSYGYGVEFSPDNTKLYVTISNSNLYQYDVSIFDSATIVSSIVSLGAAGNRSLQLAPDGKIYGANAGISSSLNIVNDPNAAGIACNFVVNSFPLTPGVNIAGLPNQLYYTPIVANFTNDTVCVGLTTNFYDSSYCQTPTTYNWDFDDPSSGVMNTSVLDSPTHVFTSAGTFNVQLIVTHGCRSTDTIVKSVIVDPLPIVDAGNDTTICIIDSIQLQGSGTGNISWLPNTALSNDTILNPISTTNITTQYFLTITGSNGCIASDSVIISLSDTITANIIADTLVCSGQVFQLNASGGISYNWIAGIGLSATTISNPTATISDSSTFTVIAMDSICPNDTTSLFVDVLPLPIVKTINDTTIDLGNNIDLTTSGATNYIWTPSNNLDNTSIESPIADPIISTIYIVTGTDSNGCTSSDSVLITVNVNENFYIPDAFSPNNDGDNDILFVRGLQGEKTFLLKIYDRWGNIVFKSENKNDGWDGNNLNKGVYVYWLNVTLLNDLKLEQRGNITLTK